MIESDERLFERLIAGDAAAFDALYARHERHLFGFLCAHLGEAAEAEDVLHETFLSLLEQRASRQLLSFRAWLFQVARNACLNRARTRRRAGSALKRLATDEAHSEPPHLALEQLERARALEGAVRALPGSMGELYHLRAQGLSYAELAGVFQVPLGTIKSRLHELVRRLQKELEP